MPNIFDIASGRRIEAIFVSDNEEMPEPFLGTAEDAQKVLAFIPDPEMIAELEEILAGVKRGDIRGFAMAYVTGTLRAGNTWISPPSTNVTLMGAVALLQQEMTLGYISQGSEDVQYRDSDADPA